MLSLAAQCIVIGPVCVFAAGGVRTLLQPVRAVFASERFFQLMSVMVLIND